MIGFAPRLLFAAVLLLSLIGPVRAAEIHQAQVEARIPFAPRAVVGSDGRTHLAYEIHVTNFYASSGPLRLTRVAVFAGARAQPLKTFRGAEVGGLLAHPPEGDAAKDGLVIDGGKRAVLFLWVDPPAGMPVTGLRHQLDFVTQDGKVQRADGVRTPVVAAAPIVIGPPLRGRWLANEGPGNHLSHHWGSLAAIDGQVTIPQRFAIDWFGLDAHARAVSVPADAIAASTDADWTGFRADVLAVANGVVRDARDGVADGKPLAPQGEPEDLTNRTLYGNFVVLQIAPGVFAHYAHLSDGSVKVRVGDHVRRGAVIGAVGQTGAAGAPHLHFQVSNAAVFEQSEGLPFVIDAFDLAGSATIEEVLAGTAKITRGPSHRRDRLPLDGDVIDFPNPGPAPR